MLSAVSGRGHSRQAHCAGDSKAVDIEMKLRFSNANHVGTDFGGSLLAMTDAFDRLMRMANPGARTITCGTRRRAFASESLERPRCAPSFACPQARLKTSARNTRPIPKYQPVFSVEVKGDAGVVIAEVEKVVHLRQKQAAEPAEK